MGSVISYLNTSWTAFTGMQLFLSKMHCPLLFASLKLGKDLGNCSGARSQQAMPTGMSLPSCWRMSQEDLLSLTYPSSYFWASSLVTVFSVLKLYLAYYWWQFEKPALCCAGRSAHHKQGCARSAAILVLEWQSWPPGLRDGQQVKPH